jgi:HEAT repeat protein
MRSADVAALTAGADLIVVGQVSAVVGQERTTVDLPGGPTPATKFHASLRSDRVLKGNLSTQDVSFYFLFPDAPVGFQGVVAGQYGMFFLKASQGGLEFVDPAHPALPAMPNAQLPVGPALDQVTAMLAQVLAAPQTSDADRFRALEILSHLQTDLASGVLRQALRSTSGELRLTIAATLVAHNDITGLEPVATALLHPAGLSNDLLLNLAGSLGGMKDPNAVPTLAKLVEANNPDINRFAAAALRQTGSSTALEPLSHLLGDPNLQTRYYAVIGFGEITHQDAWSPAFDEFQQHEEHYLSYWRVWAQTNLH